MEQHLIRLSKFISLVLRHQPEKFGVTLDAQGWANVSTLIHAANQAGVPLTYDRLIDVVRQNDKQRFTLSADGKQIRANQGHSITINLNLPHREPPDILYHGTAIRFLPSIRREGLRAGRRQHVHLSLERQTAKQVGRRHGEPVVLTIQAGAMYQNGMVLFRAENGVWLTAAVPPEYILIPNVADECDPP